ncbi:ankyrin repeat-containing domain protein [Bipolaris maydis]|nr:ankyrin repeat-containing domain protein [Bipolaris maydis]
MGQNGVQKQVQQLHERHDLQEAIQKRQCILEELNSIDYESQQRNAIRSRQAGTGQWLLNSQQYQDWLTGKHRTLFCPGIPGAGKTVLASIINEDLRHRFHADPQIGLAHLFFDYRRQDQQSNETLLSGLLKQLVAQQLQLPLPKQVDDFYKTHRQEYSGQARTVMPTLEAVIASFSRVFIVLDALDECLAPEQNCTDLICAIQELQKRHKLQLLATSRPVPEVTGRFTAASVLQIQADAHDVQKYLAQQIHRLPGFVRKDVRLQDEVISSIVAAVQGMFLLAKLHLNSMIGKRSKKALRTSLHNLATGSNAYDSVYEDAMLRIEGQLHDQRELAKEALAFLTCTKHHFSKLDLEMALGAESGNSDIDPDNFPDIYDVVTACAGLVTVNEESDTVGLAHYTTQEYLERTQQRWFPDAQALITDSCLSYLYFLSSGDCWTVGLDTMWQSSDWCVYSAKNWGYHARQVPASHERVMELLLHGVLIEPSIPSRHSDCPSNIMHLAAMRGHDTILKLLLDHGADVDLLNSDGRTALHFAVAYGSVPATMVLLEAQTNVNIQDNWGWTPLHEAAAYKNGNLEIFQQLINYGSAIYLRSHLGRTILHDAVLAGNIHLFRMLVKTQADVNVGDYLGQTPLHEAAAIDDPNILKHLLSLGASVEKATKHGVTPLMVACWHLPHFQEKLEILLAAEADLHAIDCEDQSVLMWAMHAGPQPDILRFLLDQGADPQLGVSPLSRAMSGSAAAKARAYEEDDDEEKKEWAFWQQEWEACIQILKDFGAE